MTEFEQKIADALTPVLAAFGTEHDHEVGDSERGWTSVECICSPREVAEWLAPRVTEALMVSYWAGWDALAGQLPEDAVDLEGANRHGNRYGGASGDGVLVGVRVLGGGHA